MIKDGREIASMGAETDCDLLIQVEDLPPTVRLFLRTILVTK